MRKTNNLAKYQSKKQFTKSEKRLYAELIDNCIDNIDDIHQLKMQYRVDLPDTYCILDIAIPVLKFAIRVMGGIHGLSITPLWNDELQKERLENLGWTVLDIYQDERPDLWE